MLLNKRLIANRFQIEDPASALMGEGAMGYVYRGIDLHTGEMVAVKVLKPEMAASDPDLIERFTREGEMLRQLNHPNIVKMLMAVTEQDPVTQAELHFLIMEYVNGGSLEDLLAIQPQLPVKRALQIGLEVADALSRAHHLNIIHRDLKPANVLLSQDGTPRLTDFGIAHLPDSPRLTQTGVLIGTVGYLSPEVCNLQKPDTRSDIWAFGVMLFEMLSGEHPFIADGLTDTLIKILKSPTPDLTRYRNDLPSGLIELINQMLEKNPDQRIGSARLVAARLEALLLKRELPEPSMEDKNQLEAPGPSISQAESVQIDSAVRRNQLILLEKVRNFWIHGVLEQCVPQNMLIGVEKQRVTQEIDHPWGKVLKTSTYQDNEGLARKSTLETYLEADRSLLILGSPGSGKTITLLTLAKELVKMAEKDPTQPIPVILNLASWAGKRGDLGDWIIEELTVKYQIPRKMGRDWLEKDEVLLLLDGLDEIPDRHLPAAISAINRFRETNGLIGLIVCCRTEAYHAAGVHLKLGGAIQLQPLTGEQINGYLAGGGTDLEGLRLALQNDPELLKIARSPMWLSIMRITFPVGDSKSAPARSSGRDLTDSKIRRQRLVQAYIQQAYQRRDEQSPYAVEKTNRYLSWLARILSSHNQAVYLIEQMQPGWLPSTGLRLGFLLMIGTIKGLWIGAAVWLLLRAFDLDLALSSLPSGATIIHNPIMMIGLHLILGFVFGMVHGLLFERRSLTETYVAGSKEALVRSAVVGVVLFVISWGCLTLLGENNTVALFSSMWSGAFFLIITANIGDHFRNAIHIVEALSWSWKEAFKQLWIGLAIGTASTVIQMTSWGEAGIKEMLPFFLKNWLLSIAPWTLMFFVMGGLRGKRIDKRSRVNQGIWQAVRNAIFASLLSAFVLSAFFLLFGVYYHVSALMALWMAAAVGVCVLLMYGGHVIDHYVLRVILWVKNYLPRNLVRFLDHTAELGFLRKVGGGYIFTSRLLQDFFAAL